MPEDPRELARRLAEQAKAKLNSGDEDPRELARRLAEEAKRRAAKPETPGSSLSDAPPPGKISAQEALRREREARKARQASGGASPRVDPSATLPSSIDEVVRPSATTQSGEVTSPGGAAAVVRVITSALPGANVVFQGPVTQIEVARALWRSHLARAQQDRDPQLVTTAAVILDALARLPHGQLVAVRATVDGRDWAFWVDVTRESLVASAFPAEVYLAGL